MRLELITQLQALNRSDVVAACSHVLGGQGVRHPQMVQLIRRSLFCPVLPGDTQSSKRLSEVVLEGCIPVFLGPPFHTLPLASDVDYGAMGVFLLVKQRPWVTRDSEDQRQFRLWKPDANITRHVAVLERVGDVYAHLKTLAPEMVAAKQAAVRRERLKFLYSPPLGSNTSSVLGDLIVNHLCAYAASRRKAAPSQQQQQEAWAGGEAGYGGAGGDVDGRGGAESEYADYGDVQGGQQGYVEAEEDASYEARDEPEPEGGSGSAGSPEALRQLLLQASRQAAHGHGVARNWAASNLLLRQFADLPEAGSL